MTSYCVTAVATLKEGENFFLTRDGFIAIESSPQAAFHKCWMQVYEMFNTMPSRDGDKVEFKFQILK